jgi:serine/threonine protein kinase
VLTGKLGQGAFAEVWEATRDDGHKVALKFLDTRAKGSSLVAGEVRVLRQLSELRHPNVIHLHGVFACAQYVVLIMERATCNLGDLRDAYKEETGGGVPPAHALELLEQAASALDFLAGAKISGATHGLQHCDVKPTNLLMVGHTLKIADFGLAAGSGWQTHQKGWKGTRPYAAPELFKGSATVGTDQFALAVTFCELVMGERPFWEGAAADVPPTGLPIDLTKLREREFPVISRALHPYPSSRWPSCTAFIQALRKVNDTPREKQTVKIFPRGRFGSLREARA